MNNYTELYKWFNDKGDYTHNLNYELNEDSVVIELGGYKGIWAQQIFNKYKSTIYIIEPLAEFYNFMNEKFKTNNKIHLLNVGISTDNKKGIIYTNGDSSSSNTDNGIAIEVEFNSIETLFNKWNISQADLIQINIEGDEYTLLENMIKTGMIHKFKNIQIQFHIFIDNCVERRNNIREYLINNGFKLNFDYPFVWESWKNENYGN